MTQIVRATMQQQRDEMVRSLRDELRRLVRDSGSTQRAVEEANGFTRGYLSQVLQGHVTLTARHVLGILLALDVSPGAFFQRTFEDPGDREQETLSEIRERMARYDAAFEQLERKGLITPDGESDS